MRVTFCPVTSSGFTALFYLFFDYIAGGGIQVFMTVSVSADLTADGNCLFHHFRTVGGEPFVDSLADHKEGGLSVIFFQGVDEFGW